MLTVFTLFGTILFFFHCFILDDVDETVGNIAKLALRCRSLCFFTNILPRISMMSFITDTRSETDLLGKYFKNGRKSTWLLPFIAFPKFSARRSTRPRPSSSYERFTPKSALRIMLPVANLRGNLASTGLSFCCFRQWIKR